MSEHGFAKPCFDCDYWFNDPLEWADELLRCDPLIFRNALVKPGYNTAQSSPRRMEQFVTDRRKWYNHIEGHLKELTGDFSCHHPACSLEFESLKELRHHLVDVHCYQPPGMKQPRNNGLSVELTLNPVYIVSIFGNYFIVLVYLLIASHTTHFQDHLSLDQGVCPAIIQFV